MTWLEQRAWAGPLAEAAEVDARVAAAAEARSRLSSGHRDPGHFVLEGVLVLSAGVAVVAFVIWFVLFAGAIPVPLGISL